MITSSSPSTSTSLTHSAEGHHGWDRLIHSFLVRIGFTQAVAGFTADLVVLNPVWEQNIVPDALRELKDGIAALGSTSDSLGSSASETTLEPSLDERKLSYIQFSNEAPPRTQSTINKEISRFLAQKRARNDASNRAEFVYTPAQKRESLSDTQGEISPSCARVDAKPIDRDVQMKYDIAQNDEGPLSRTMHANVTETGSGSKEKGKGKEVQPKEGRSLVTAPEEKWVAAEHPGLDERLRNVETHLAWPPPPRQTPIIVPPHLRPKDETPPTVSGKDVEVLPGEKKPRKNVSSLHRAVLEKLEVKQAMDDLA
ncbi:hypothetical protein H0H92_013671 [Tricholoma furcatifolium]|nr:hypothetical protein H0H92_013671 [Tricholoma furcatifolium]